MGSTVFVVGDGVEKGPVSNGTVLRPDSGHTVQSLKVGRSELDDAWDDRRRTNQGTFDL
jgi:hypothetical protein